ncbi:YitT family protein [Dendrosporobacter sp. 1207_IL3150]|uniref:YitT family protein n=1 Tax=Dendrosporobacter sp. 1207_IL3150 TaxID=3084054 RepID=UPI002FD948E4
MPKKQNKIVAYIKKYLLLFIGAIITSIGLEIFLVPNNIIDGGIIGISIMLSHITQLPLSFFIVVLNIPFLYLGYMQIGKTFTISTLFSVLSLAYWVAFFLPIPSVTQDLFLAAVFGGITIGVGVGIIIRYGGSLDGTEIVAIIFDKRTSFSVGEIIMFMNLFILGSAGLVFGWDKAMYSLVAYYIAFKVIDIVIEGLDESKAVLIVSDNPDEIADALMARLGRGVTVLHGEGGYTGEPKKVLYSVVTRLEVAKLKLIVQEKDENAFVTINEVHDVMGGRVKKKAIH